MKSSSSCRGLFIAGTGTGVGKTIFTAALAMHLRKAGVDVGVMKPLESGVEDVTQAGEDGSLLRWAAACTDPLELTNLIDDENYRDEIKSHLQAIINWQGTDSLTAENYLDNDAAVITQPNVTKYNDGHRDSIIEYFQNKMNER